MPHFLCRVKSVFHSLHRLKSMTAIILSLTFPLLFSCTDLMSSGLFQDCGLRRKKIGGKNNLGEIGKSLWSAVRSSGAVQKRGNRHLGGRPPISREGSLLAIPSELITQPGNAATVAPGMPFGVWCLAVPGGSLPADGLVVARLCRWTLLPSVN